MMIFDCHIHIEELGQSADDFNKKIEAAGVQGGMVISLPPAGFYARSHSFSTRERLDDVLSLCQSEQLYPFYWVDPLESDALQQVAEAASGNISGFKIICDRFFPHDEKCLKVCKAIAETGCPLLLHSGILWNDFASSRFNRPAEFEALLEIPGLRFALAHIGWPWCDELIAVYGKAQHIKCSRPELGSEMFIDVTPGTPQIYRRKTLIKMFKIGYDIEDNVLFGLDNTASSYDTSWATEWIERDKTILNQLDVSEQNIEKYFSGNLLRFVKAGRN